MNSKLVHFEKYSVAPSPSRNYYGIKVLNDEVILYLWKISHGPHFLPEIKRSKFTNFHKDKNLRDEILYAFGTDILNYIKLIASEGPKTLLSLPKVLIEKLVEYLELKDIAQLFCVSRISNEIFNSEDIWEYLYKREKGSNELSDMERELAKSMGYKKLARDYQVRNNVMKKTYESPVSKDKSQAPKKSTRNDKIIVKSASVNMLKQPSTNASQAKTPKKKTAVAATMETPKSQKSTLKQKSKMPKKSTSEGKAFVLEQQQASYLEKHPAAGEGYAIKKASKSNVGRYMFVSDDHESAELHLHKEYIKTAILQSDLSNADLEDIIRKKNLMMLQQTPRNKSSTYFEETKQPPKKTTSVKHKSSVKKKVSKNNPRNSLPGLGDESDEGGMSYLMKRYLEASDEVAKRINEDRSATRSSGIQVDMPPEKPEKPETPARRVSNQPQQRRMSTFGLPPGNAAAAAAVTDNRPVSRNFSNPTANILTRLRPTFKKA